jgi:hypothetical protein
MKMKNRTLTRGSTKPQLEKEKDEYNHNIIGGSIPKANTLGNIKDVSKAKMENKQLDRIINGGALLNLNITPHSSKVEKKSKKLNSLKISL